MMDDETYDAQELLDMKAALHGTPRTKLKAQNFVEYLPKAFIAWFFENRKTMSESNNIPYFVTENMGLIKDSYKHNKL